MSDYLVVSMYLDDDTAFKYFHKGANGINNKDFPENVVPFAPQSNNEQVALKKFARAHRAGHVTGTPKHLLTIRIPSNCAVGHFVDKTIKVLDHRPEDTIGFTKPVTATNYPSMQVIWTKIDAGISDQLLQLGLQLLCS